MRFLSSKRSSLRFGKKRLRAERALTQQRSKPVIIIVRCLERVFIVLYLTFSLFLSPSCAVRKEIFEDTKSTPAKLVKFKWPQAAQEDSVPAGEETGAGRPRVAVSDTPVDVSGPCSTSTCSISRLEVAQRHSNVWAKETLITSISTLNTSARKHQPLAKEHPR